MVMCIPMPDSWPLLLKFNQMDHLLFSTSLKEEYILPFMREFIALALDPFKEDVDGRLEDLLNNSSLLAYVHEDLVPDFFFEMGDVYKELTSELMVHHIAYVKDVLDVSMSDLTLKL